jgi:type IV pilus assembly protein PilY1
VGYEYAKPRDGELRYEDVVGDGLPPSATAGLVTLDTGQTVPFCIGCSGDSPLESKKPTSSSSSIMPKGRLYWYLQK